MSDTDTEACRDEPGHRHPQEAKSADMDKSKIEWTDATWNPIRGCSRVSEGCRNCYAEKVAKRFNGPGQPYGGLIARTGQWNGNITVADHLLELPLTWKRPRRIFVNSMSDLFHENVPFETIASIFAVMAVTTRHTYQILTKRPARMLEFFKWALNGWNPGDFEADDRISDNWPKGVQWKGYDNCGPMFPYENIWLLVSVENQETADERIPLLQQAPAAIRGISVEPLLSPIKLRESWITRWPNRQADVRDGGRPPLDWVVVGGESGKNARPMHPDWARSLRDQCIAAGAPFFFKQWGERSYHYHGQNGFEPPMPMDIRSIEYFSEGQWHRPTANATAADVFQVGRTYSIPVGKKRAGRILDGQVWDQYPIAPRWLDGAA